MNNLKFSKIDQSEGAPQFERISMQYYSLKVQKAKKKVAQFCFILRHQISKRYDWKNVEIEIKESQEAY